MDTLSSWRSDVRFTDRMSNTLRVEAAFQAANPGIDTTTARAEARRTENTILQAAASREEYNQLIQSAIQSTLHEQKTTPHQSTPTLSTTACPASQPQNTQSIGPYTNCTHHTTGLSSTLYHVHTKPPLAIKLTHPPTSLPPHNPLREARLLRHATSPHIIDLLTTHTLPSSSFLLVFPYLPLTLGTLLAAPAPIAAPTILAHVFEALAHLHALGILHRDLKPSNILLQAPAGPAYLADFGIAWRAGDIESETADAKITDVGTTCYRAPELLFGDRAYGVGVDLWAGGCVLAEVVGHNDSGWDVGRRTLFDAGELGSELRLVKSIFETLGTPDEAVWPESATLPDWGKMSFVQFPPQLWTSILPGTTDEARDLVASLVRYQSTERLRAAEVLKHPFFRTRADGELDA